MIITGKIKQIHRTFDGSLGTIEQTKSLPDAKTLVNTEQTYMPVRVTNFGPKRVKLKKGYTIAIVHPVNAGEVKTILKGKKHEKTSTKMPEHLKPLVDGMYSEAMTSEKAQLKTLLIKYQNAFMTPNGELGGTSIVRHEIQTGDAKPVSQKLRLPPMHLQAALKSTRSLKLGS